MRHHIDAQATVMAHRSPHGGQQDVGHEGVATRGGALSLCTPPETEISSIIHSIKSHEPCAHGTFLYTFFKKRIMTLVTILHSCYYHLALCSSIQPSNCFISRVGPFSNWILPLK